MFEAIKLKYGKVAHKYSPGYDASPLHVIPQHFCQVALITRRYHFYSWVPKNATDRPRANLVPRVYSVFKMVAGRGEDPGSRCEMVVT